MAAKFFAVLTNLGAAKLANAAALGTKLEISQMAVGDGGGTLPIPDPAQAALKGEKRRASINLLTIDPANTNQIIAEQVIPESEGGWWIREIGLFDKDGALIAIANCPETYKPQLQEGSGRTQTIRVILIVSSTDAITLKIDPAIVLATRQYVDDKVIEVKAYADDVMAKHLAAMNPHNQYAPKASPALTGTPTAPTAVKGTNSTQIASTGFVQAALAALLDSAPATLDTLKELADALGNDPNFANTVLTKLSEKLAKDQNGADIPDIGLFAKNLHLERLDQDLNETRLWSPDRKSYIFIQNDLWGAYSIKSPAGNVALDITSGGTGAKDAATARANLGLGNAAPLNVGSAVNTVAAGNDSRIVGAAQKSNNLSDLTSASVARSNLGLGTAAVAAVGNGAGQIPSMANFTSGAGWMKFPDGTIIQRGIAISGPQRSPAAIPFPIPFTQTGFIVTTSFDSATGAANDCPAFATTAIGLTGFYLMSSRVGNDTGAGANWIAVGR